MQLIELKKKIFDSLNSIVNVMYFRILFNYSYYEI